MKCSYYWWVFFADLLEGLQGTHSDSLRISPSPALKRRDVMVIDSNEVILFGEMLPSPHQCGVKDINVLSLQVRVVIFACTARLGSSVTVDHLIIFFSHCCLSALSPIISTSPCLYNFISKLHPHLKSLWGCTSLSVQMKISVSTSRLFLF